MPGNDVIINGLKDQSTRFVREIMPHLPKSTQGNMLILGLFLVSQCAKEQGLHRTAIDEFLAAVAGMLQQSTGKDPTPAIASTFRTLISRSLARGIDLSISSTSRMDEASGVISGLASDLLELANEPTPSNARIEEITNMLAVKMTAMQSPIRKLNDATEKLEHTKEIHLDREDPRTQRNLLVIGLVLVLIAGVALGIWFAPRYWGGGGLSSDEAAALEKMKKTGSNDMFVTTPPPSPVSTPH